MFVLVRRDNDWFDISLFDTEKKAFQAMEKDWLEEVRKSGYIVKNNHVIDHENRDLTENYISYIKDDNARLGHFLSMENTVWNIMERDVEKE